MILIFSTLMGRTILRAALTPESVTPRLPLVLWGVVPYLNPEQGVGEPPLIF
jgi:hypothetical protein